MLHEGTEKSNVWDMSLEDTNMWLTDPLRCLNSCTQINSEIEVSDTQEQFRVLGSQRRKYYGGRDLSKAWQKQQDYGNNYGTKHCPSPAIIFLSKIVEEAATCH